MLRKERERRRYIALHLRTIRDDETTLETASPASYRMILMGCITNACDRIRAAGGIPPRPSWSVVGHDDQAGE